MLKPEERHCKRLFHGMMDMREAYDPDTDMNAYLSDDIENFKMDPELPEDVEIFNCAFLDRIARIYQNREEYFNGNKEIIDLFDCYSNLVYQFHMIEFYKPNLLEVIGEDEYNEMKFDDMFNYVKSLYTDIIACSDPKKAYNMDDMAGLIDDLDKMSVNMRDFGYAIGMPF